MITARKVSVLLVLILCLAGLYSSILQTTLEHGFVMAELFVLGGLCLWIFLSRQVTACTARIPRRTRRRQRVNLFIQSPFQRAPLRLEIAHDATISDLEAQLIRAHRLPILRRLKHTFLHGTTRAGLSSFSRLCDIGIGDLSHIRLQTFLLGGAPSLGPQTSTGASSMQDSGGVLGNSTLQAVAREVRAAQENVALNEELEDDRDGEGETLVDDAETDEIDAEDDTMDGDGDVFMDADTKEHLRGASKGVKNSTESSYQSLMKQFLKFAHEKKYIPANLDPFAPGAKLPQDMPWVIVAWILSHCNYTGLDGKARALNSAGNPLATYSHAQKMRAAMTFGFGRVGGRGREAWQESEFSPGEWRGNPSVSLDVSAYMLSLRRRKVAHGDTTISARALTPTILKQMHELNTDSTRYLQFTWCTQNTRAFILAVVTLAFVCLLRIDEVLRIQVHDLKFETRANTGKPPLLKVTLPFRKTAQFGEILPFEIAAFPEYLDFICPVRAVSEWLRLSNITEGYLFPKLDKYERPVAYPSSVEPMPSDHFLRLFRNNLADLDIHVWSYGTHSFRRGGCQWLHLERRWPLRRICEWGGWSQDFSNATIVKYLISHNDTPTLRREDFFDFTKKATLACPQCNRSCMCGY